MVSQTTLVASPLIASASLVEAGMSYRGMWRFLVSLGMQSSPLMTAVCVISAISALSIESEIFADTIRGAFEYVNMKDGLRHRLIHNIIRQKYNQQAEEVDYGQRTLADIDPFLQEYATIFHEFSKLKSTHSHDQAHLQQLITVGERMLWMEKMVMNHFSNDKHLHLDSINTMLSSTFTDEDNTALERIHYKKTWQLRIAHGVNALSFAGAFFGSVYFSQQIFLLLGITGCAGGLITFAALTAVGYFYMMYHTFKEIIHKDLHVVYWNKFRNAWRDSSGIKGKATLILGCLLAAALVTALTLGTAGTWLQSGAAGQAFLFSSSLFVAKVVVAASALIYTVINVIFNIKNIAELVCNISIKKLCRTFGNYLHRHFVEPLDAHVKANNILRPDRLLAAAAAYMLDSVVSLIWTVYKVFGFIAHCLSEGVTTDNSFSIPVPVAAAAGTVMEGLNDAPFICNISEDNKPVESKKVKKITEPSAAEHHHADMVGRLLFVVLAVPLGVSYLFHYWVHGTSFADYRKAVAKKFFGDEHDCHGHAHKHAHGHDHKHGHSHAHGHGHNHKHSHAPAAEPALSENGKLILKQQCILELDQKASEYQSKDQRKAGFFESQRNALFDQGEADGVGEVLKTHRYRPAIFSEKPTASQVYWDDMQGKLSAAAA